ncbi:MAG: serine/threonine-protein kinase [Polyangiales bacterium]
MAKASSNKRLSDPGGQRLGPYELVRRLGVGGMAETFEAIRRGPGGFTQRVCLKLVQPFFRDKPDFLEMFEREARLAAQLRHSNIVGVIDFGRIEGATYMALELVDGIDLATLLDAQPGRRLSHEHVALIGHQLAQALEHAHDPRRDGSTGDADKTIIHRDVSPSNVMISRRGEVLLTDFGVAKAITGTARKQSAVKGKVPYMSPEQLRADDLDGRSDLFSLGVVLFEALAGQRPFQGEHDPATIMKVLQGDRPSLRSLAPHAPAGLCDVIEGLLATDAQQRPPNAGRVMELLEPFIPPPREGRELGRMASDVRALLAASSEPVGRSGTDETSGVSRAGGSLAPAGLTPGPETKAERSRRRHLIWMLLAAVVAVWMWWGPREGDSGNQSNDANGASPVQEQAAAEGRGPPQTSPSPDVDHEDTAQMVGESVHESNQAEGEARGVPAVGLDEEEVSPPPRVHSAYLSVFVFPWGRVWIDGRPYGKAPLQEVSLKPGKYKVSAGQEAASETKTVRLQSGDRRTIQFDLTE